MLISRALSFLFQRVIGKKVFYYGGETAKNVLAADGEGKLVVVVGRSHYAEWSKKYPVSRFAELKKIVANEYGNTVNTFSNIGELSNGTRQVSFWQFDRALIEKFPDALFFIPETLLIGKSLSEGTAVEISASSNKYFLSKFDGVIKSAAKTSVVNTLERYCASVGIPYTANQPMIIDAPSLLALLPNLNASAYLRFFSFRSDGNLIASLRSCALLSLSVVVAYNLLVSSYLFYANHHYSDYVQDKSGTVQALLDKQNQLRKIQETLSAQQQFIQDKAITVLIWGLLDQLNKANIEVKNVTYEDGSWVLQGSAAAATTALKLMKTSEFVQSADFESAVSRQSDKDVFVIRLQLKKVAS